MTGSRSSAALRAPTETFYPTSAPTLGAQRVVSSQSRGMRPPTLTRLLWLVALVVGCNYVFAMIASR